MLQWLLTALFDLIIIGRSGKENQTHCNASPFLRIHPMEMLFSRDVVAVWDSQLTADFIEGINICLEICNEAND